MKHGRRGRNEGTIYQRADGRWEARIDLGWRNGKRWRKCFYGKTRKEVAKQLNPALADKEKGRLPAAGKISVEALLNTWLEEYVTARNLSPSTYEQYKQHVRLYLVPELGKTPISKLSAPQVHAFVKAQREKLSARTVEISLFVLRNALDMAMAWDWLYRNVAKVVENPKGAGPQKEVPTVEQARSILEAVKDERLKPAFAVALSMGLRRGEVLALRWTDIDFAANKLSVRQTLQRVGGKNVDGQKSKLIFKEPKSVSGRRTISMPDLVVRALNAHKAKQAEERLKTGAEWKDLDLVFATSKGTPIEPRRATRVFKDTLAEAKLSSRIRLHDSRHFATSLLVAKGIHPKVAQDILGHSEFGITMNTYAHVFDDQIRDAMDKVNEALA